MSKTTTKKCVCLHEYQDEKYGKWQRVFNMKVAKQSGQEWKCTVCGNVRR